MNEEEAVAQEKLNHFLAEQGQTVVYKRGETIIHPEHEPNGVFYLIRGFVAAYNITEDGDRRVLYIYKAGELFSLHWAFRGDVPSVYYEAIDDIRVYKINKAKLVKFTHDNREVITLLLSMALDHSAAYARAIFSLGYKSARQRVIFHLITLAERFGKGDGNTIFIDMPVRHIDIADAINVSRETASRVLEKLAAENLIVQRNKYFLIPDLEKIKAELNTKTITTI